MLKLTLKKKKKNLHSSKGTVNRQVTNQGKIITKHISKRELPQLNNKR